MEYTVQQVRYLKENLGCGGQIPANIDDSNAKNRSLTNQRLSSVPVSYGTYKGHVLFFENREVVAIPPNVTIDFAEA